MKMRDYMSAAVDALPMLAGCVGVVVGGYWMLCAAPAWIGTAVSLMADAACAAVCGIGAGAVLAVCAAVGGRKKVKKEDAREIEGRGQMYVGREVVCRAARRGR